ncbi:MAG: CCC motif membrane protein [Nonlabens sp.]|nr:CCC motif membrane protein [Nonlabens sp.]MDP5101018.1 CCC motif membrane protein [Nonlabens sp.]
MQKLNTTLVYILSVVGFLCCCFYGAGTIAAIIAIVIATKELKKFELNPDTYSNGKAMKTAKIVAYVSLFLSFIGLAFLAYYYTNTCEFWNWYLEMMNQNPNVTEEQREMIYAQMAEAGCR